MTNWKCYICIQKNDGKYRTFPDALLKPKPMPKYCLFVLYLFLVNTVAAQDNAHNERKIKSAEVFAANDILFILSKQKPECLM